MVSFFKYYLNAEHVYFIWFKFMYYYNVFTAHVSLFRGVVVKQLVLSYARQTPVKHAFFLLHVRLTCTSERCWTATVNDVPVLWYILDRFRQMKSSYLDVKPKNVHSLLSTESIKIRRHLFRCRDTLREKGGKEKSDLGHT
ncbi:hypothetical protein VNO77_24832 [Canavalia gladiata]|uniref:Uncharacterized protein n=1 Tax=Canavalia gladiata TaxID=3824 RepID=A0AAN9QD33_CANGL